MDRDVLEPDDLPPALLGKFANREPLVLYLVPWRFLLVYAFIALVVAFAFVRGGPPLGWSLLSALAVGMLLGFVFLERRIDIDVDGLSLIPLNPLRRRQTFPYAAIEPFDVVGSDKQLAKIIDPAHRWRFGGLFPLGRLETKTIYGLSYRGPALGEAALIATLNVYHPVVARRRELESDELAVDLSGEEVRALLVAVDKVVAGALPLREPGMVAVDGELLDVLRDLLGARSQVVRQLRLYRAQRERDGETAPVREELGSIAGLSQVISEARPAWESKIMVDGERLSRDVALLHGWIEPVLRELEEYRLLYPELPEEAEPTGPSLEEVTQLPALIEELQGLLSDAAYVPLTSLKTLQVRIDPAEVEAITSRMRAAVVHEFKATEQFQGVLDRLDAYVRNAKGIPFSGRVRLAYDPMYDFIEELFDALVELVRQLDKPT